MIVVPDASPLIYLAGAGHLDLLRVLYARVIVPRVLFDEVATRGAGQPGAGEVRDAAWLEVVDVAPDPALLVALDRGEAAAIPLALALHAELLCDDAEARALAKRRGLFVVGTIGVLLRAKDCGHIVAVRPIMDAMSDLGMWMSAAFREEVLLTASESANRGDR